MAFTSTQRVALPVTTFATNMPDGIETGNALRIDQYDPQFSQLNDGSALFYRILSMFRSGEELYQPKFSWFEDDIEENTTTVAADAAIGADVITLAVGEMAAPNMKLINVSTGEHVLVTTSNGDGVATCQRGIAGTTAAAMTEGDVIVVAQHLPAGGDPQEGRTHLPVEHSNWCSFYSRTASESDIQGYTEMLDDVGHLNYQIKEAMILMMRMMDSDLRLGRKNSDDTVVTSDAESSKRIYTFDGLEAQIGTALEIPVSPTWSDVCASLNPFYRASASSPRKTLMCGPGMFEVFTKTAWDRFTQPPAFESTLGAVFAAFQLSEGGVVEIVNDTQGMGSKYGAQDHGYLIDLPYIEHRTFRGMGLQVKDVTNAYGHHIQTREIFASQSLQVKHGEDLHATLDLATT